ncbi:hypothetical protein [Algibacter mikhailovii]|uniref:hypothetical protein n=1 Tax=Algibacter mikhailovii TaxID=425498 RepID=UPI0024947332|nr:hypothetical protein [Algibacter mikhailovii]
MNRIIINFKMFLLSFLITGSLFGQQKLTKLSQSIKVNKDVNVKLNTSNCNVIFDTWNKNTIEIEAYIEGEQLNNEELQEALKSWDIDIDGTTNEVTIKTKGDSKNVWVYNVDNPGDTDAAIAILNELQFELADIPDIDIKVKMAKQPPMPPMPPLPELPELPEGIHKIKFDFEAYKKDGDKYLEEYSKAFEEEFGEDFAKKMEAWGEKFGEQWSENYELQLEDWAKSFEDKYDTEAYAEKMEAWAEKHAAQAERQAARIEQQIEREHHRAKALEDKKIYIIEKNHLLKERHKEIEHMVHGKSNSRVKKTIKIKLPKSAKLKVDVRHGEIEFASTIDNLQADLAYTKFKAHSINGRTTSINASYSPINVAHWSLGELNLNYVKNVKLENVDQLVLNATSSNIEIENLRHTAVIDGNIGDLKIMHIDDAFSNLNIIIQNCNAVISLPKLDHNLQYKGSYSKYSHPDKTTKENKSNFSAGNPNSNKNIVVNAKYSTVNFQ